MVCQGIELLTVIDRCLLPIRAREMKVNVG